MKRNNYMTQQKLCHKLHSISRQTELQTFLTTNNYYIILFCLDDYGSSADTETEMPLSQDGFDLLRSLKPLSSDELYSVVKTESEDDVCTFI